MAQINVAEEIRAVEELAKSTVQEARLEGVRIVAAARAEGDERVKGARQAAVRLFRERLAAKETEANGMADQMVEEGNCGLKLSRNRWADGGKLWELGSRKR